jgi:Zn-finger nucleic acid-binding protein
MICPRDGAQLAPTRDVVGPGTAAQVCPTCKGVMLDWITTQMLFKQLGLSVADLQTLVKASAASARTAAPKPCVDCGKGQVRPFSFRGLELDLCEGCGTCWFDAGELSRVTNGRFGAKLTAAPGPAVDPKSTVVGTFEMFWDCGYCDAKALLGATHRYCPQCGAPQDASKRYFPPEGKEVVANTSFDGVDRTCPACGTPNGAKANNCRHCGSPLEGASVVSRLADRAKAVRQEAAQDAARPRRRPLLWLALGALVLAAGFCVTSLFWTRSMNATVTGHSWRREIDVERLRAVRDEAWCDALPSGAYAVSRGREQRSTKKIADGEECNNRDVDKGNGTFERRRECKTRYREEPVYDEKCHFSVDRWQHERTLKAEGEGLEPAPRWPPVDLPRRGGSLGDEREGSHRETYSISLKGTDGKKYECSVNSLKWAAVADGVTRPIKVGVITHSAECDTL